jgi:hypothetical protein
MYVVATVIFIELIMDFWYGFLYSPNYLDKLWIFDMGSFIHLFLSNMVVLLEA